MIENGKETVFGEAYQIADGIVEKICDEDQEYLWN